MSLLEVDDLSVSFETPRGLLRAVEGASFSLEEGETLGIVGESGCGKSLTSLALMGLLPPNARVAARRLAFAGKDLLSMPERERRRLRGGAMTMIFQDPMSSLNPCYTVGFQIAETLREHGKRSSGGSSEARGTERARVAALLKQVGIPAPETRLDAFPHQLSGGMCQRVMIAMAIACRPRLLIADEPTTALDVTIQAQILRLLKQLQAEFGMALVLITHDLGVVANEAGRIQVMYAGRIVERGPTRQVIEDPRHPYTRGLLASLPGESAHRARLTAIAGTVPDLARKPSGCLFHPRCPEAKPRCESEMPPEEGTNARSARCFFSGLGSAG